MTTHQLAVSVAGGYRQPTIALYNKGVLGNLDIYLAAGGRKVNDWLDSLQLSEVVFDNIADFDNINSREDLVRAEQRPMRDRGWIDTGGQVHSPGKV